MRSGPVLSLAAFLIIAGGAAAQESSDTETCNRLISMNQSGLYISYPSDSRGEIRMVKGAMPYASNARFYFVPGFGPRLTLSKDEGVWHIRTQTRSPAPRGTDTTLVYRPAYSTRCDPQGLQAFDENERFLSLLEYQRYHATSDSMRRPSTALSQGFHFRIKDKLSAERNGCSRTDDRLAFPDPTATYGLDAQGRNEVAEAFTVVRSARSFVKSAAYDGLSSEFAYDPGGGNKPACFGFTMALPTNGLSKEKTFWGPSNLDQARRAGQSWKPVSTSLVIKRLRGRDVLRVYNRTVEWEP